MEDFLDQAAFLPLYEPLVHCLPWSVSLRQIPPCCPAPGDPKDSVQHVPRIFPRTSQRAGLSFRKILLQPLPFFVCELVAPNDSFYFLHPLLYYSTLSLNFLLVFCIFSRFFQVFMTLETHSNIIIPSAYAFQHYSLNNSYFDAF